MKEYICGKCSTNLDDYQREVWPERFVEAPVVGSFVESESGKRLQVVLITHCMSGFGIHDCPYIKIELSR